MSTTEERIFSESKRSYEERTNLHLVMTFVTPSSLNFDLTFSFSAPFLLSIVAFLDGLGNPRDRVPERDGYPSGFVPVELFQSRGDFLQKETVGQFRIRKISSLNFNPGLKPRNRELKDPFVCQHRARIIYVRLEW